MFRRIVMTALVAGALAGIFVTGLQMVTTVPLIIFAEEHEGENESGHEHGEETTEAKQSGHDHDHGMAWMPEDGFERHGFTLLTSVLMGVGYGFMLTAVFALRGQNVDTRQGVLWGLAGFASLYMAPALGMPPELPGMMAGDFDHRQLWWIATAIATAISLSLMVFGTNTVMRIAGVVIMVIPHVVGAPHPDEFTYDLPAEVVAQFAVSSLVTVGLFWVVLGGLAGYFFNRFEDT